MGVQAPDLRPGPLSVTMAAMRMILAAVALCLIASTASADEWTVSDTAFEATFLTLIAVDYLQTKQIVECARSNCGHLESNPIMGERGERVPPEVYFVAVGVAHAGLVRLAPKRWRPVIQILSIGAQVKSIGYNWTAGYSLKF